MDDNGYRFDASIGQLFFVSEDIRTPLGDIDLAIAFTTDEDGNACLHKHGMSESVMERAKLIRSIDETCKTIVIPWEAISHPEVGPLIIDEVNLCLAVSGRVGKLEAFLRTLTEKHDVHVFPRFQSNNPAA